MKKLFSFLILTQAILWMSCGGHKEIANSDPSVFCIPDSLMLNITLDTVKSENVMSDLKLSGKISFNEDDVVKVFPQVSGHVGDVRVSLGDFVQRGQLLATIRTPIWQIILTSTKPRKQSLTSQRKIWKWPLICITAA